MFRKASQRHGPSEGHPAMSASGAGGGARLITGEVLQESPRHHNFPPGLCVALGRHPLNQLCEEVLYLSACHSRSLSQARSLIKKVEGKAMVFAVREDAQTACLEASVHETDMKTIKTSGDVPLAFASLQLPLR
jgi:hypothetical protein